MTCSSRQSPPKASSIVGSPGRTPEAVTARVLELRRQLDLQGDLGAGWTIAAMVTKSLAAATSEARGRQSGWSGVMTARPEV